MILTIRNDLKELSRLAERLSDFGQQAGLPPSVVFEIQLALDEIVTNIISYGYTDEEEHHIHVLLERRNGELVITVDDDARAFNPLDVPTPDLGASLNDRPIGGLGIHLVRRVMDNLDYRREQDRNILVLTKQYP